MSDTEAWRLGYEAGRKDGVRAGLEAGAKVAHEIAEAATERAIKTKDGAAAARYGARSMGALMASEAIRRLDPTTIKETGNGRK